MSNFLRRATPSDVLKILAFAAAIGGLLWSVQDIKTTVARVNETAVRSERELIRLNTLLEAATKDATRRDEIDREQNQRLRDLERGR